FELEMHDAVVVQHGADPAEPVGLLGRGEVGVQQSEPAEARCRRRLDPLPEGERAAQVGTIGGGVTRAAPTGGQEIGHGAAPRTRPSASRPSGQLPSPAPLTATAGRTRLPAGEESLSDFAVRMWITAMSRGLLPIENC